MSVLSRRVFLALGFVGCLLGAALSGAEAKESAQVAANITDQTVAQTISVYEVNKLLEAKKPIFFLDVRQQDEFDAGHIEGAKLIPLDALPSRAYELPKDKTMVVYCRSGRRSAQAVAFLRKEGFSNAFSLSGGFLDWDGQAKARQSRQ